MYLENGNPKELFSDPLTYEGAWQHARNMADDGYEVIAVVTVEHAAERKAMLKPGGGLLPGAHLTAFVNDIIRRFRQDYPGVPRESALEAISLLCKASQRDPESRNLQKTLLDEIHEIHDSTREQWRQDMRVAIANRRPEGE